MPGPVSEGTREAHDRGVPVKARAALVDPENMAVTWMNEAARDSSPWSDTDEPTIDRVVPMAQSMGVVDAMHEVARTGEPVHLHLDIVSMSRGSVALAVSVYRLPSGELLVLAEHAWRAEQGRPRGATSRRLR